MGGAGLKAPGGGPWHQRPTNNRLGGRPVFLLFTAAPPHAEPKHAPRITHIYGTEGMCL